MNNESEHNQMDPKPQDASSFTSTSNELRKEIKSMQKFQQAILYGSFGVRRVYKRPVVRRSNVMSHIDLSARANLKDALLLCIIDALSQNTETRRVAEEKMSVIEILEDFPIYLCDFSQNKNLNFAVRQMSSVLLKQYIDLHWDIVEEHNVLQNCELRNRIKKQLLEGLKEVNSKIRNAFAYCISYIGSLDFPEKWPSFFEDLHVMCVNNPKCVVHGILRIYEEVIRDFEPQKANHFAEPLLREICFLLNENDHYDVQIRSTACHVLCLYANICDVGHVQVALIEKLVPLCEYFVEILQAEESNITDYGMKTNIIRFFTLLVQKLAAQFGPYLLIIMPTIWNMVTRYGDVYVNSVINNTANLLDIEDDEGKVVGYTPLVLSLFDFIHSLVDTPKLNLLLIDVLSDIFYYIMIFMHITRSMEEAWLTDPNTYFEDDSSDNFDSSIRVTARDVLLMICTDFDSVIIIPNFSRAISRYVSELRFVPSEWKVHECAMCALSCIKSIIYKESISDRERVLFYHLVSSWQFALRHPEYSVLCGRALWFAGQFAPLLNAELFDNYMKFTLSYIKHSDVILKMFATRAIFSHCSKSFCSPNRDALINHLPNIVECLLDNLGAPSSTPNLSALTLDTLKYAVVRDVPIAESVVHRTTSLIMNLLMKYHSDPVVVENVGEIVEFYCCRTGVSMVVQDRLMVPVANILNLSDDKVPCGLQSIAMDLLQILVKYSKPPMNENLILMGFPAAIKCILHNDDYLVLNSGSECLRSYLLNGIEQVCNYRDLEGTTGLEYVLRAISQLLDPSHSEIACSRIGRLIITLINKAGPVLASHMHFLLRTILSKMQRVERMDVWQSLLIVFVYLFYSEVEFVVNFLTSVPGPTGTSALEFVLIEWLNRESFFVGTYDRTVNVMALTKLLEYSVTSEDTRFDSIMVRDLRNEAGWTQIPILGKIFKVIWNELALRLEKSATPRQNYNIYIGDSDESDDSLPQIRNYYTFLDNDPDRKDVLYAQDKIFTINILAHLTEFMEKFKTIPRFQWFVNLLTSKEKNSLGSLGIV